MFGMGGADTPEDTESPEDTAELDVAAAEELAAALKSGDGKRILEAWRAMPPAGMGD